VGGGELVDGFAGQEGRPIRQRRRRGIGSAVVPACDGRLVVDLEAGVLLGGIGLSRHDAGASSDGPAGGDAPAAACRREPVRADMAGGALFRAEAMDTERSHAETLAVGIPTLLQDRQDHSADGPGTRRGDIVYDFENVFDWRSGPRRGLIPAPIPIRPSP